MNTRKSKIEMPLIERNIEGAEPLIANYFSSEITVFSPIEIKETSSIDWMIPSLEPTTLRAKVRPFDPKMQIYLDRIEASMESSPWTKYDLHNVKAYARCLAYTKALGAFEQKARTGTFFTEVFSDKPCGRFQNPFFLIRGRVKLIKKDDFSALGPQEFKDGYVRELKKLERHKLEYLICLKIKQAIDEIKGFDVEVLRKNGFVMHAEGYEHEELLALKILKQSYLHLRNQTKSVEEVSANIANIETPGGAYSGCCRQTASILSNFCDMINYMTSANTTSVLREADRGLCVMRPIETRKVEDAITGTVDFMDKVRFSF